MQVSVSYREVWRIAWPIMLSSLGNTIINFTDVAFVSRIGDVELASSALGGVFYFLLVMIGMAIGTGAQIMIARREGEGRPSGIGIVFDNSLLLLLFFAFAMSLFLYTLFPTLLHLMIRDDRVADCTVDYIFARGWGLFPMMMVVLLRSFYTGITLTRIITITTLIMMLMNVLLNYVFVFGAAGIEPMGIRGSGLASALSEAAAAIFVVTYTLRSEFRDRYGLFRFSALHKKVMGQLMVLSGPIVLQHLLSMGSWFFFFVMIEKLGPSDLAVSNVIRTVYMVLMTPVWGFAQSANSMVSNIIGQNLHSQVLKLTGKIALLGFLASVTTIALSIIFRDPLFHLCTSDQSLIDASSGSFFVVCSATLFFSVSMVMLMAVSGTGMTGAAMRIEILSLLVYLTYVLCFTFWFPQPLSVVWMAETVYWILMGLLSYSYLRSGKWWNKTI